MVEAIAAYQKALRYQRAIPMRSRPGAGVCQSWQEGSRGKDLADLEKSRAPTSRLNTLATIYASLGEKDKAFDSWKEPLKNGP